MTNLQKAKNNMVITDDKVSNALHYASMGWRLFPVARYKDGQHLCLVKWTKEATDNEELIRAWAKKYPTGYFCVALAQSNLTVIDVDNKKGKDGSASLKALELDYASLPKTLTGLTPSKGQHLFFKGSSKNTTGKIGIGLDSPVMVPIPGSDVQGKGKYSLVLDVEIAELPSWLSELLGARVERKEQEKTEIETDLQSNIDAATKYLTKQAPIAREGEQGDATTYQVCCRLHDLGISSEKALELLLDLWNDNNEPPWSSDTLQIKVQNAYQYAQNATGCSTAEYDFRDIKPVKEPEKENDPNTPLAFINFIGIPPKRVWVLQNYLPKGEVSALYGDGGLGKSRLALQLAMHVASGEGMFLGQAKAEQMPVLCVVCEDTKDEIHRRLYAIKNAEGYEFISNDIPLFVLPRAGEDSVLAFQDKERIKYGPFYKALIKAVKSLGTGHKLLLLDTLSDIFTVDTNSQTMASQCVKTVLAGLVKYYDCTVLVVAHPTKAGMQSGTFDGGSPQWRNSLRNMLFLKKHENKNLKDYKYLCVAKTNYAEIQDPLLIKYQGGVYVCGEQENMQDNIFEDNCSRVLEIIKKQADTGTPLSLNRKGKICIYDLDIANSAGGGNIDPVELKRIIVKLVLNGRIEERTGQARNNGLYVK